VDVVTAYIHIAPRSKISGIREHIATHRGNGRPTSTRARVVTSKTVSASKQKGQQQLGHFLLSLLDCPGISRRP
jgi:hypothetical protein